MSGERPWKRVERIGDCTLYLGDCLEVMPHLGGGFDVFTDPPYGIGAGTGVGRQNRKRFQAAGKTWDDNPPPPEFFRLAKAMSVEQIYWGGNYFELPPTRCYLIWDKGLTLRGRDFAEAELAWTSLDANIRVLTLEGTKANRNTVKVHPTQKPLKLTEWGLGFLTSSRPVLDPFMGSGTTGVACAKLGRRFVGIERDPDYFEAACNRIGNAHSEFADYSDATSGQSGFSFDDGGLAK